MGLGAKGQDGPDPLLD